ncbi:hypothetical protein [Bradyrhizobium sp. ORS 86]|uniref:hypothetical protein n=1 Tax=Bradyrhizobium sp. ORS 86 TaxID=1685970 RepID=UPI00388EF1FC
MALGNCDICNKFRPGSSGTAQCGTEGFFCHVCRGDTLDPYCEIEDEIESVEATLATLIGRAETGAHWAEIAAVEVRDLAPLLALRMEAAHA